jgi:hypothetical protein
MLLKMAYTDIATLIDGYVIQLPECLEDLLTVPRRCVHLGEHGHRAFFWDRRWFDRVELIGHAGRKGYV